MKKLVFALCLLALPAFAGEQLLGTITSTGTSVTNATTALSFNIYPTAKLSLQCDAIVYVATDATTVSSTTGVKLAADVLFPTAVAGWNVTVLPADGGTTARTSARVAVISASGTANCKVFERSGKE